MAIDSDLELMVRVSRGDTESFEALLHRHRTPLVNYFSRMVRDPALAEDLAQELFLRVYQARGRAFAGRRALGRQMAGSEADGRTAVDPG